MMRLNSLDTVTRLKELSQYMYDEQNIDLKYSMELNVGEGKVNEFNETAVVGINGLSNAITGHLTNFRKKLFHESIIEDVNLTRVIVATFHEANHIKQFKVDMQEPTQIGKRLAINDIACTGSKRYYTDSRNYYHNVREILAEYNGIIGAKSYFETEFPEADVIILANLVQHSYNTRTRVLILSGQRS